MNKHVGMLQARVQDDGTARAMGGLLLHSVVGLYRFAELRARLVLYI